MTISGQGLKSKTCSSVEKGTKYLTGGGKGKRGSSLQVGMHSRLTSAGVGVTMGYERELNVHQKYCAATRKQQISGIY